MGGEAAAKLETQETRGPDPSGQRSSRLRAVSDVVRLYQQLEDALRQTDDVELARLAGAARDGGKALEEWAGQIESFRDFKQRFARGVDPSVLLRRPIAAPVPMSSAAPLDLSRPLLFAWQALAFLVGFVVSLLVT